MLPSTKPSFGEKRCGINRRLGTGLKLGRAAEPVNPGPLAGGAASLPVTALRRALFIQFVSFSVPALSIVMADPLMSCLDALCVGRYATTIELAALGPCLVVSNFLTYLFFFLTSATTLSASRALGNKDLERAADVISMCVMIAGVLGFASGLALVFGAFPLLSFTGCVPELIPHAVAYLQIRALAQPAVLISMVLQAGLLAQGDSLTPAKAILLACLLNSFGDVFLIRIWGLGLQGAAAATSMAQWALVPFLLRRGYSNRNAGVCIRLCMPSIKDLREFFSSFGPLFIYNLSVNLCYSMVNSLATSFSTVTAAAHQVAWAIWSPLAFMPFPVQQCCQVFLSKYLAAAKEEGSVGGASSHARLAREAVKVLVAMSVSVGLMVGLAGCLLVSHPGLLTKDAILWPIARSFVPYMLLSLLCIGFTILADGIQMVLVDIPFLAVSQFINMAVLFLFLRSVGHHGILSAWWGLCLFQLQRAIVGSTRSIFRLRQLLWRSKVRSADA